MESRGRELLEDIREAAAFIRQATQGKTLEEYKADQLLRYAIERCFEIIGEAVGRLTRLDPRMKTRIVDHARIISFRNVLIHGYDLVNHAQVWQVISEYLPALESDVESLLNDSGL